MRRRLRALTGAEVERIPPPCDGCLRWERGERCPGPGAPEDGEAAARARVRKQAWASAQTQDGFPPGRLLEVDGSVVGWALFAPAGRFATPALAPMDGPTPRPSRDALQLATLRVVPGHRGQGYGRLLLQATLREAVRTELRAVEAVGDRRWREPGCLLPAMWLLHEGFTVHREALRTPLLRLELKRTARWAASLEAALDGILEHVPRPEPAPSPSRAPMRAAQDRAKGRARGPSDPA